MTKIIAELCQNHNGDRNILAKMIKAASDAGADYVKGQIIFSEDLTYRPRFEEGVVEEHGIRKSIKRPFAPELERM
ncbi:MAG: general stress protein, partial [Patescibacteria group bacterium]